MKEVFTLIVSLLMQVLLGGFLGGLTLKFLARPILKSEISSFRAWCIESTTVFFSVFILGLISILTPLQDSHIGLKLLVGFPISLACRTLVYAEFVKGHNGRPIGVVDAIVLAVALATVWVGISALIMFLAVVLVAVSRA